MFWRQNLLSAGGIRRSNEQSFADSNPAPDENNRTDMAVAEGKEAN
jgi:hypothetical protein